VKLFFLTSHLQLQMSVDKRWNAIMHVSLRCVISTYIYTYIHIHIHSQIHHPHKSDWMLNSSWKKLSVWLFSSIFWLLPVVYVDNSSRNACWDCKSTEHTCWVRKFHLKSIPMRTTVQNNHLKKPTVPTVRMLVVQRHEFYQSRPQSSHMDIHVYHNLKYPFIIFK
jgi:hypothetical protein